MKNVTNRWKLKVAKFQSHNVSGYGENSKCSGRGNKIIPLTVQISLRSIFKFDLRSKWNH